MGNASLHTMGLNEPVIAQEDKVWVVRVEKGNGRVQEFRCATEAQARTLLLVLKGRPEEAAPP